jgi:hypothetical protein
MAHGRFILFEKVVQWVGEGAVSEAFNGWRKTGSKSGSAGGRRQVGRAMEGVRTGWVL